MTLNFKVVVKILFKSEVGKLFDWPQNSKICWKFADGWSVSLDLSLTMCTPSSGHTHFPSQLLTLTKPADSVDGVCDRTDVLVVFSADLPGHRIRAFRRPSTNPIRMIIVASQPLWSKTLSVRKLSGGRPTSKSTATAAILPPPFTASSRLGKTLGS